MLASQVLHFVAVVRNLIKSDKDKEAALIAAVEREEGTPEEMFAPEKPDLTLIDDLMQKGYIEAGEKPGTYYATDKGLDFSESR